MSILKIEAFAGLSGDMFLGALAELTNGYEELQELPGRLQLENVEVRVTDVEKAGIACRHIKILDHNDYGTATLTKSHDDHSHSHTHTHTHSHSHSHSHTHAHSHVTHSHDHGHHAHRHLKDIYKIIDEGDLTPRTREIAKKIFHLLGLAESKVHGVEIDKIHFHEVGAIDSILDIVGSALLLDKLQIERSVATPVCTGHGFVMADHGIMPIPAPATKELLLDMPTYAGSAEGEMTTPTGAAIMKYLDPSFDIPVLIEKKTGHGPGEKDFEHPNVLRLSLCQAVASPDSETIYMVETNIDDMPSELLGHEFQDKLLKAGALDFYYTQVLMKKGRPGLLISVFASKSALKAVSDFLLENTSTIGIRSYPASRNILKRSSKTIQTSLGDVDVKEVELPSGAKRRTIEFESGKKIAESKGMSVTQVYNVLSKEI